MVSTTLHGCGDSEREPSAEAVPEAATPAPKLPAFEAPKNLLFVILDAFNAGHAGYVGYGRDTTPNLDGLARSGIGFTRAHSQSANTLTSAISYLVGRYPPRAPDEASGNAKMQLAVALDNYTLAEAFADAGYRTAAFTESPWISGGLGFRQGFDVLRFVPPVQPKEKYPHRVPGATAKLFALARSWIRNGGHKPWFCYLHAVRPHNPYGAPAPFGSRYSAAAAGDAAFVREVEVVRRFLWGRAVQSEDDKSALAFLIDRYDANVTFVDHLLGELVDWLRDTGLADDTLVIVASDHGEAFGQHGRILHNSTVYEEMIHVPLVMLPPASLGMTPRLIEVPVEMVDLYPTIVQLFSLKPRKSLDGKSLAPLMFQLTREHKAELFSQTAVAEQIAVRKGSRKLILTRNGSDQFVPVEMYDLSDDPGEKHNLLSASPPPDLLALAEWYRTERYLRPPGAGKELDESQEEMLRALGYLQQQEPRP